MSSDHWGEVDVLTTVEVFFGSEDLKAILAETITKRFQKPVVGAIRLDFVVDPDSGDALGIRIEFEGNRISGGLE